MKLLMENWKKFLNETELRIYGTQNGWKPPEDDPKAKDPGAWRSFRDNEYLELESASGYFFIHSEQKRFAPGKDGSAGQLKYNKGGGRVRHTGRSFITHKPSGKQIPENIILLHPDFSGKNKLTFTDLKKYMAKLDQFAVENIPDIASETLSQESEAKIAEFVAGDAGRAAYQPVNEQEEEAKGGDALDSLISGIKDDDGIEEFLKGLENAGIKADEVGKILKNKEEDQKKADKHGKVASLQRTQGELEAQAAKEG